MKVQIAVSMQLQRALHDASRGIRVLSSEKKSLIIHIYIYIYTGASKKLDIMKKLIVFVTFQKGKLSYILGAFHVK